VMRLIGALIAPSVITAMMIAGFFIVITFQNQVPPATQQVIAEQMPFMSMPTKGNLVLSFGSFLLATLVADIAVFVPVFLLSRHNQRTPKNSERLGKQGKG
jgi:hypothetical protein